MKYALTEQQMTKSMVTNEVLFGQDPAFLDEMGVRLDADLGDCRIVLSGIPRATYTDRLGKGLGDFLELYRIVRADILHELGRRGIVADIVVVKFDQSKRICCIMTGPGEPDGERDGAQEEAALLGAAELVHRLLVNAYRELWGLGGPDPPDRTAAPPDVPAKESAPHPNAPDRSPIPLPVFLTALSRHIASPRELHAGFEEARRLADLAFFVDRPQVMTAGRYRALHRPLGTPELTARLARIERALLQGDLPALDAAASELFADLARAFSYQACDYALAGIRRLAERYGEIFLAGIDPARLDRLNTRAHAHLADARDEARAVLADCARASHRTGLEVGAVALEAVRYLRRNHATPLTVREVAAHVGVSPSYLSRVFNNEIGQSIPAYLARVRLNRAKVLLETTDEDVAAIAERVGFGSAKYFAHVFRAQEGASPAQYRQAHRAENEDMP